MDPFSTSHDNNNFSGAGSGDVDAVGIDDFSLDKLDYLNDSLSLQTTNGGERSEGDVFSLGSIEEMPSPSTSQFESLNLQASTSTERGVKRDVEEDNGDVDVDDPFAALEAAIEEDKPKTEPSPEWKRMLDAIKTEEDEQQPGALSMVPENPPPRSGTMTDTTTAAAAAAASMPSSSFDDDIDLDAPILLHPVVDNNTDDTSTSLGAEYSPSRVLASADQQESATTSDGGGGGDGGTGLAGAHTTTIETLSEDPAQEIEDIRRRSFAVLQPICSTLLTHRNNAARLTKLFIELKQALLNLQPAGVESCVDYVIFPLQVALDAIAYTRAGDRGGGGGGGGGGAPVIEQPSSSSSATAAYSTPTSKTATTTTTSVAFLALKSDKTAEALLSVLLILLQRGTKCSSGDQLLSLLHRLCGIIALPRELVSEEIRLGTLKVVTAALRNVPHDQALQFSVREESSAPLLGHLGSVLVKAAAAELEAGTSSGTGSKIIRIEALKALKLLIQTVNDADALSFFLPGLTTGLARALLAAGGGRGRGGGSHVHSQGPAASGAATVEALQGLTCLLQATLCNESVAEIVSTDGGDEGIATATVIGAGAAAAAAAAVGQGSSHCPANLSGDAALAELLKLSNKKRNSSTEQEKEKQLQISDSMKTTSTKVPPVPPQMAPSPPPQPGEAPKLRVDRTEAWVRGSAARIEEMLGTVLPPLASDPRAAVREALVQACAILSTTCSLALSGCLPVLTDIILALAQDSWPAVAAAARSWLNTDTAPSISAANTDRCVLSSSSSSSLFTSSIPILATAECSLKTWIYDLPAALRHGDEAGKAHALKITTCLETCPPHWIGNHLLSHSTEVGRLIDVLADCFAVDAGSAGLLLVAAPEAAGTAFTSSSPSPSSSVSVSLPRMPLGLQYISTQKTYESVANLVRTLAAVAVAADNNKNMTTSSTASGTALRSLIDGCLQHIQRLVVISNASKEKERKHKDSRPGAGVKKNRKQKNCSSPMEVDSTYTCTTDTDFGNPISWTISAAQVVFVLTEIIFGASTAWQPSYTLLASPPNTAASTAAAASLTSSSSFSSFSKELEALIVGVLPELVDTRIWSLPTAATSTDFNSKDGSDYNNSPPNTAASAAAAAPLPSSSPGFTSKDRGSNALLQRAILDCIGTSSRALGLQFTSNGRLIRSILLPVIQKLGDPCRIVAASADTTIQAMCTFCGYAQTTTGGLRQLVADNADYIVDGLCRQLRQPEIYPLAPQLFAALLRQGGVAPGLVPLLAEPARQALLGISIIARKKKPEHVLSFVLCLREIARGAGLVAKETCVELENFAVVVEERRELLLEKIKEQKEKEKLSSKIGVVEEIIEPVAEKSSSESRMEEINKYFEDYRSHKQRTAGKITTPPADDEDMEDVENDLKVPVALEEWNQIQISRRKAVSCATLAQSASDTASPLILSSALPVAIQSIKTCSEALEVLKYASRGVEICAKQIDPVVMPPGGVIGPTPDPTTTAFLPSVHLLWSPLMGALGDWRVAVVESVLSMLSHVSQLAGSFLTRRFSEEAWPVMQRLLKKGPCQKRIIAPGQDDLSSPAVVQRAQRAVLACLRTMATGGQGPEAILSPVAGAALVLTADLMGEKHPAVIREHATNAFVALSGVDPDAAWGLLVAAIRSTHSAAATAVKVVTTNVVVEDSSVYTISAGGVNPPFSSSSSRFSSSLWCLAGLPSMSEICPAPPTSAPAETFVPKGLQTCGKTKLLALMRQVNQLPVHWHNAVEKILVN
ncbi:hypothetical protein Ndes2526B_g00298 [Nannochloris sp. 'desiccata']|nr:hypothetical protein KSW81_003097 [Chlorella desiccata (nom. nud.)]